MKTLTEQAQVVLEKYLQLPMLGAPVNAPYFNNDRVKTRAGLAATIGKGNPEDLALETEILAKTKRFPLETAPALEIKKFMTEHNLGVDCSALVYYVLRYEVLMRARQDLPSILKFPNATSLWRKLITKMRPVENTSVAVFGAPENSFVISKSEVQPGDFIVLWNTGLDHKLNHILLITEVNENEITYAHSFRWRTEGQYDHGVRVGTITWKNKTTPITDDLWVEKNQTNSANDTWQHAIEAQRVELRRLNCLR